VCHCTLKLAARRGSPPCNGDRATTIDAPLSLAPPRRRCTHPPRLRDTILRARQRCHIGGDGAARSSAPHVEASDRRERTSVTSERQTETGAPLRTPRKASLVDSRAHSVSLTFHYRPASYSLSLSSPPPPPPPPPSRDPASLSLSLPLAL